MFSHKRNYTFVKHDTKSILGDIYIKSHDDFQITKKKKVIYNKSAFKSDLNAGGSIFRQVKKIKEDYSEFNDYAGLTNHEKRKIENSSITNRIHLPQNTSKRNFKKKEKGNNISIGVGDLLKYYFIYDII